MNKPIIIKSISEIERKFDNFIIDQWGVIHNGKIAYKYALKCIEKLYSMRKNIILVSNSSKKSIISVKRLKKLGFNIEYFKNVITSGQVIHEELNYPSLSWSKKLGNNYYYISNNSNIKNDSLIKDLKKNRVNKIEKADFILGSTVNPKISVIDYLPLFKEGLKNNIPFICANPDYESVEMNSSNNKVICMGTLGKLYESCGGKVYLLGKPSKYIFDKSILSLGKIKKSRTIVIGDSIAHDIKGASNFGVKSLLITSGIHKNYFLSKNLAWNNKLELYEKDIVKPNFLCKKFLF